LVRVRQGPLPSGHTRKDRWLGAVFCVHIPWRLPFPVELGDAWAVSIWSALAPTSKFYIEQRRHLQRHHSHSHFGRDQQRPVCTNRLDDGNGDRHGSWTVTGDFVTFSGAVDIGGVGTNVTRSGS
jgi:hypothetical protein